MDTTRTNCISIVAENHLSNLSNSTTCGNSGQLEEHSFGFPDKISLDKCSVVINPNLSLKENVSTGIFESIDASTASNNQPSQPPQLENVINTSSIKSETSNFNVDDDRTMYKLNELLSELCQNAKELDRNVSHDTTSSSILDNSHDDISLLAPTEFKSSEASSEETTVKPMSNIRVRQNLIADKAISTYPNPAIRFYEDIDYEKDKDELISLGLLTNFTSSDVTSAEMASRNEIAKSLPIMEPIFKQNVDPKNEEVYRQPKKDIPFANLFTRMNLHQYKHTYFDSDGNEITSNPQTSSETLPESSGHSRKKFYKHKKN